MLRDHFTKCHAMPPAIQERYLSLKANASQGATDSKKYWIESAISLGLVDTSDGIRFHNSKHHPLSSSDHHVVGESSSMVILEEEADADEERETVDLMSSI